MPKGSSALAGQSRRPPAFEDTSPVWKLARKKGQEATPMAMQLGKRKSGMPITSIQSLRRGEAEP